MGSEASDQKAATAKVGVSGWVWTALLTVYFVWGSTYLAIRIAVQEFPPFLLGGIRFVIAGGVLYFWCQIKRGQYSRSGRADPKHSFYPEAITLLHWRETLIVGGLLLWGGNGAVIVALRHVTSSMIALLVATTPFWLLMLGKLWFNEKVPLRNWLGMALGIVGVYTLMRGKLNDVEVSLIGSSLGLLASLSWAFGTLYARRAILPKAALLTTSMEMLGGGFLMLGTSLVMGEWQTFRPEQLTIRGVSGLVYLIVAGSWIGFTAYAWLLKNAPLSLVSSYAYVNPVVALILGVLILGEPVTSQMIIAAAIIIAAVALAVIKPKVKQA